MNLWDLLPNYDVLALKDGYLNKGWAGQLIEQYLGLKNNNEKKPDFGDFELKTIPLIHRKKGLRVKETMAITIINPTDVIEKPFLESDCYHKLKDALLVCRIVGSDYSQPTYVHKYMFLNLDDKTIDILNEDYEIVRHALKNGEQLSGRMGTYIQPRTKGPKNSNSRAFYARARWLNQILLD